ncbi:cytidine/deoxycytidylate deaminase family protein [Clostridium sp. D2Q-11]|uniref:Cytidine/deoxycytidylate deaminase family protein n=1 Tax=Anaeromonas frigoriresistens TaxID=2683708 RepID=A0A942USD6_9FIRM|nr:cytidine/deoxycytidylate deaminase family protein [Anaeromonas frigoriresistens]MBS4538334.1 cytidine/deoxycytidylate deaminase family protein [Anaeromonas frigoriresistens]
MRKDWDTYFMDIAFQVAERSTCPRLHVGAVIVNDKRIKGTGYNGSPAKLPHCEDEGCYMHDSHCKRTIHAEMNCLLETTPNERKDATIYVTHQPCPECQKLIITSGITRVVYSKAYQPEINWFDHAPHIEVVHLDQY